MHPKITLLYNSDVLRSFCITTYYLQYNQLDDIVRADLLTFTPPYYRRRYSVLSTQYRPCTPCNRDTIQACRLNTIPCCVLPWSPFAHFA